MSGNRKIGKRSIIGSVVAVQTHDGFWRRGSVVGIRNTEDRLMPFEKNFEIELTDGKFGDKYFCEDDIYGHGFNTSIPHNTKLLPGQRVFVTHEGREVKGRIQSHNTEQDVLTVELEGEKVIIKTLEEIRLLESRKSARLGKSVLDFSKLAEMGHPYQRIQTDNKNRRRLHSMSSFIEAKQDLSKMRKRQQSSLLPYTSTITSDRIDVPQSRKRRTSESLLSDDAESGYLSSGGSSTWGLNGSYPNGHIFSSSFKSRDELRDCTAAMVLMNLSTSPLQHSLHSGNVSPTGSTSTPHPSPVPFQVRMAEEEGPARKCARSVGVMFKCTWRGCLEISADQNKMERHVRGHLGRREPLPGEERDMEEEFYYTEIELDVNILNQDTETQDILDADFVIDTSEHSDSTDTDSLEEKQSYIVIDTTSAAPRPTKSPKLEFSPQGRTEKRTIFPGESLLATSAPPSLSFIPENHIFRSKSAVVDHKNIVFHKQQPHPNISEHFDMVKSPPPSTSPILLVSSPSSPTSYTSVISPTQMMTTTSAAWNPKKLISIIPKPENVLGNQPFIFSPPNQVSVIARSDKKCRKLYGLEQKDLWCTQCKWKKACARFN